MPRHDPYFDKIMFGKLMHEAMDIADCTEPGRLARLVRMVTGYEADAAEIAQIVSGTFDKCDAALLAAIVETLGIPGGMGWFQYAFRPATVAAIRGLHDMRRVV